MAAEEGQVAVLEELGLPKVQDAIDKGVDRAVDTAVERALAEAEQLLNGRLEGVHLALAEHRAAITAELELLAEKVAEAGVHRVEAEAGPVVEWAHQKIDGVVTAVERALGISIAPTLPPAPGVAASTHTVEVTGAEKAGSPG